MAETQRREWGEIKGNLKPQLPEIRRKLLPLQPLVTLQPFKHISFRFLNPEKVSICYFICLVCISVCYRNQSRGPVGL